MEPMGRARDEHLRRVNREVEGDARFRTAVEIDQEGHRVFDSGGTEDDLLLWFGGGKGLSGG
jgi:hypothetical protein